MDMDGPLDFEAEDPLFLPSLPKPKRRKVIGLDDLLTDHYKEKKKQIEKEARKPKKAKVRKSYDSDEEEDDEFVDKKEVMLSQFVNECEKQVQAIKAEEDIPLWGLRLFGDQKTPPQLLFPELGGCSLLESFMDNKLNSVLELSAEKGQTFIEGLLINGWLPELVFTCGHVDASIATWTFNLMLYSLDEALRASAYNFWCTVLPCKDQVGPRSVKIDWFPSYGEVKGALEIYGYLPDSSMDFSSLLEMNRPAQAPLSVGSDSEVPAQNIRFWVKFVAVYCQMRNNKFPVSSLEVEDLLSVVISLFLDRQLQGLTLVLYECMLSATSFFTDEEWGVSCKKVAKSLASRAPKDLNCLRLVECLSGVNTRIKQLRSELALQILISCFDKKVSDGEETLRLLVSINVKAKNCDFFILYVYLVLTENWLFSNPLLEAKPLILEMWGVYLRNCSCHITSTDMRSYASKVRNKASYLLQSTIDEKD